MNLAHIEKGWIMFHRVSGSVWNATFAVTRAECVALARELWAKFGATPKENSGWKPIRSERIIIIHHKPL